jgi:hypothetical protein
LIADSLLALADISIKITIQIKVNLILRKEEKETRKK